ncbi:hypothetical protein D1007_54969 [Hordeum vulgare]|uniref:Uncharacterized protein n=1 Tax=Hordeum vulgare subsp. vulgare TaxID=112509 RepID=A0A8I6Z257_HORVV|nr:hypothetical protein D1007_54969 [Hordeum vulgare]KAI4980756.1 hypothetical protein ZWY2020_021241 [Hordeum vulgare]
MRRRAAGAGTPPFPDTLSVPLLLLLLLVATELGTAACSCGVLKAATAAAARKCGGPVLKTGPAALSSSSSGTGEARGAAYDESKRMVPQGPNPLHN